jgi:hypothetical protein
MYASESTPSVFRIDQDKEEDMKRALLVVASVAIFAMAAVPAQAAGGGAAVTGGGSGLFPAAFGSLAGDRLHIEVSAETMPGGSVAGVVHILHQHAGGGLFAELTGTVQCMRVEGSHAWVSGTLTAGRLAEAPRFDPTGQTFAVAVVDGGTGDAAGLDLSFFGGPHTVPNCEQVPTYLSIDRGNFSVSS